MPAALKMPEPELIEHAGLDSAVYVRIYLLGLKIFVPIALLAFAVLVPVNWTSGTLENEKGINYDQIDKLSISNVGKGSKRSLCEMCLQTLMNPLIVYNANHLSGLVDKKKGLQNWLIYYENKHAKNPTKKQTMKTGLWGLWGQRVDAIEYYKKEIEELCKQVYF
nr:unnamed protein product [Digitaria exilis]